MIIHSFELERAADILSHYGITHIISVGGSGEHFMKLIIEQNDQIIQLLNINFEDSLNLNSIQHFESSFDFIESSLLANTKADGKDHDKDKDKENKDKDKLVDMNPKQNHVLVHGLAGFSGNATIVAAYLMKKNAWDVDKALSFTRTIYPLIK
jgi:predicted protein tyrosine phosphatase